ncbi:MAG: metallophosphoesterase [Bacteroidetes bacterium]|nr:metallophosphoesterase [Bacteroidota bacterium]
MKIIQITDIHIGQEDEDTLQVDVRQNFKKALSAAAELAPDLLVITGDLCFREPAETIMYWVKDQIDAIKIPYYVIPGNHDDSKMLATCFGLKKELTAQNELFYKAEFQGLPLFFLDSSLGSLSKDQLKWLQEELSFLKQQALIFIHHPPCQAGVPYMDKKYAFQDPSQVSAILKAHPFPIHLFCGHYHVDKIIRIGNICIHITPSCFFQIDMHSEDFKVDHYRSGFREIVIKKEVVLNAVVYF